MRPALEGSAARAGSGAGRAGSWWALAACGFPLALWLLATHFFGGRHGYWCDDYWFNRSDPVTGVVHGLGRGIISPCWRPLMQRLTPGVISICWDHQWAAHLPGAVGHGLTAALLWRLLVTLGRSRRGAAAASMLFMVYPGHYEAPLWAAAMATVLAQVLALTVCLLGARFARGGAVGGRGGGRSGAGDGWGLLWPMAALSAAVPCLNEQPAAALGCLPLLYLAACPEGETWRRRAWRAGVMTAACLLPVVVYVALNFKTSDTNVRGGVGTIIAPHEIGERVAFLVRELRFYGLLRYDFGRGMLREGWARVSGSPAAAVWGVGVGVSLLAFLAWWSRRPGEGGGAPGSSQERARTRAWWFTLLFGLAVLAAGWAPVVAIRVQAMDSRLLHVPVLGLAVALACLFDGAARVLGPRVAGLVGARLTAGVALGAASLTGAVALVGVQSMYRERFRADTREMGALTRLVPDPGPWSVVVPLLVEGETLHTGCWPFDHALRPAWCLSWANRNYVQRGYRRADLGCGPWDVPWAARTVFARPEGVRYVFRPGGPLGPNPAPDAGDAYLVPWAQAVPLIVRPDGTLEVVTRVLVERPDNRDVSVVIPQTAAAVGEGGGIEVALPAEESAPGLTPLTGWRWASGGGVAEPARGWAWGAMRPLVVMRPQRASAPSTGEIVTVLPPGSGGGKVHLRAGFAEWQVADALGGDGSEVVVFLDGQRDRPLGRLTITGEEARSRRRFAPLSVDLPSDAAGRRLHVAVLPGAAGSAGFHDCCVAGVVLETAGGG